MYERTGNAKYQLTSSLEFFTLELKHPVISRGAYSKNHHVMVKNIGNIKYNLMTITLTISMKNAPTIGTTRNARWDGPNLSVTACIFAIAVGVAPRPKPQ